LLVKYIYRKKSTEGHYTHRSDNLCYDALSARHRRVYHYPSIDLSRTSDKLKNIKQTVNVPMKYVANKSVWRDQRSWPWGQSCVLCYFSHCTSFIQWFQV